jgi:hypothetical protein
LRKKIWLIWRKNEKTSDFEGGDFAEQMGHADDVKGFYEKLVGSELWNQSTGLRGLQCGGKPLSRGLSPRTKVFPASSRRALSTHQKIFVFHLD